MFLKLINPRFEKFVSRRSFLKLKQKFEKEFKMLKESKNHSKKLRSERVIAASNPCSILLTDHWFTKCVHTATHVGRIPRCLFGHGAYGCESLPGHSNGSRSRANVVFALSNALRH